MTLIVIVNERNYHLCQMDDSQVRALLAGTLALMTQFAESGCPFSADRRENLLRLSTLH